jgi:hypothetical protein
MRKYTDAIDQLLENLLVVAPSNLQGGTGARRASRYLLLRLLLLTQHSLQVEQNDNPKSIRNTKALLLQVLWVDALNLFLLGILSIQYFLLLALHLLPIFSTQRINSDIGL